MVKTEMISVCWCIELSGYEYLTNPSNLNATECFEVIRPLQAKKIRECVAGSSSFWDAQDMAMCAAIRYIDKHFWHFCEPLSFNYDCMKYHLPIHNGAH